MATINNLPILSSSTIVPSRVSLPVTCSTTPGVTYRLPLSTVITLSKGNIGYTGSVGAGGPQGPQGTRGFAGSRGFSGSAGPQGISGPIGPQGLRGYTGSAGNAANVTVNLSSVTSSITPVSSDVYDLGAFNKPWRSIYTAELYVNSGNIKDIQSGLPILFSTSGTTGVGYLRGFTGSAGSAGVGYTGSSGQQGLMGYTGSAGTGNSGTGTVYTGSRGFTGSSGPQGTTGFTGSAGTGGGGGSGVNVYTNSSLLGTYTSINFVGLTVAASSSTAGAVNVTSAGGGGTGYTGSAGTGNTGYTGSAGAGGIGFTGSAGTSGGGTTFVFQNAGFNYSVDGFADTTYPTLTLVRGQLYNFNFTNVTGSHPIALRLTSGNTTTVPGTTGNNASSGVYGTAVTYQVPFDAPSTIYYQCVIHSGMIGSINIVDQAGSIGPQGPQGAIGFTGSAGPQGLIGFTGSAGTGGGTGTGYTGSIGFTGSAGTGSVGSIGFTGSAGTGGIGFTGSAGSQGAIGFTGSSGTGSIGFTGSAGAGGGTTFVFQNAGFNYSVDGFADTTYPTLTLVRGQLYNFNFTNVTGSHPIALRLTSGNNTAVPGTTGNNASSGVYGTAVTYQVPFDAPSTIYYQCVIHSGMIGSINIVDQTGFTGSAGTGGIGFTGSVGPGGTGYTGSVGSVNALANGTYTISTLYVSTLTVSSVGAATIQSGNDLNLKAVGQITVNAPFVLTTATTSTLTSLNGITQRGAMVFVTDASGGAQPCYFDGIRWYTVNGRVQVA